MLQNAVETKATWNMCQRFHDWHRFTSVRFRSVHTTEICRAKKKHLLRTLILSVTAHHLITVPPFLMCLGAGGGD